MSDSSTLLQQFRALPRVAQWAAVACLGIVLFLLWDQYLHPLSENIDRKSNAILNKVSEVRSSASVAGDFQSNSMREVVKSLGPVSVPSNESVGAAALNNEVNRIVFSNGATNFSIDIRSRGKLSKASLPNIARGKRIDRLSGDLKFEATPKATAAIIAELESSPEIESVGSVRMTRDAGGKVKVHLTVEAWVIASDAGTSGGTSL